MLLPSFVPWENYEQSWLRKQPYQSLSHWSYPSWITAIAVCQGCQVGNCIVFNMCRTQQKGLWQWERRKNTSKKNLHWLPVKDCTDHTILSMACKCVNGTVHNISSRADSSLGTTTISSVIFSVSSLYSKCGWIPYQNAVQLQGFLKLWPQTLKCPPSGPERIPVFLNFLQETRESLLVKPAIAPSSIGLSFSLFLVCLFFCLFLFLSSGIVSHFLPAML